jgi:hypothetical protein
VQIDPDELRRYYASLSDESLLALDREELTEVAREAYDQERLQRGLDAGDESDHGAGESGWQAETRIEEPDWLEGASCACEFAAGRPGDQAAVDAEHARVVLETAGIPCHLAARKAAPETADGEPPYEYRLMVPGNLSMPAASVLDKEIFNADVEAEWKVYFESLSDEELRDADSEDLFAGLRDRIERATKAYREALAARGIASN